MESPRLGEELAALDRVEVHQWPVTGGPVEEKAGELFEGDGVELEVIELCDGAEAPLHAGGYLLMDASILVAVKELKSCPKAK